LGYFCNFQKEAKVTNGPTYGEKSPNLATLSLGSDLGLSFIMKKAVEMSRCSWVQN
jgi:hypothetical protein